MEQHGSRKSHQSIKHVLNKGLCMDLLCQTKRPGVITATDLKSCYDCICHNVALLCLRRVSLAESKTSSMLWPLLHLEHSIRCAFGTSKETYGGKSDSKPTHKRGVPRKWGRSYPIGGGEFAPSSNIASTMRCTSCRNKCGFCAAMRSTSSDFIILLRHPLRTDHPSPSLCYIRFI